MEQTADELCLLCLYRSWFNSSGNIPRSRNYDSYPSPTLCELLAILLDTEWGPWGCKILYRYTVALAYCMYIANYSAWYLSYALGGCYREVA